MKEYIVTITTWPAIRLTISARTPGHAKSIAWADAYEAGWQIPYTEFRAKLA